jgi:hypothetical protein
MLRWLRNLLFDSTPAQFPSTCGLEEAVKRLGAGTRKWYSLRGPFTQAAVGTVAIDRVWLRRYRPFFHNGFQPYFVGHFVEAGGKVTLVGRFKLSGWTRAFMCFWLGFCVLWTLGAAAAVAYDADAPRALPFAGLGMFAIGIAFVAGAKAISRDDVSWLSSTIRDALEKAT